MKTYLNALETKAEALISSFSGINTAQDALALAPSDSPEMSNISAVSHGSMTPREGRTLLSEAEGEILYLGVLEGEYVMCVVKSGGVCSWQYYDSGWRTICTVDESPTGRYDCLKFIDTTILVTGTIYVQNSIEKTKSYWVKFSGGTFTCGNSTVMPASDMIETVNGRICAAYTKSDKLFLGGIMDSQVWFDIADGLEQNIITQDGEEGEAIAAYADHIVYLKPHSVSELYGNTPDTYKMVTVSESLGCIAGKTVCSDKNLIWLSGKGVCAYSGGAAPKVISGKIEKYINNIDYNRLSHAAAGTDGKRYIICLPQKGGTYINCVLNMETGEWFTEDTVRFVDFARMGDTLYGACSDGSIYKLWDGESDENVSWSWKSKTWRINPSEMENMRRVSVIADVDGTLCLSCINDGGESAEKTVTSAGRSFLTLRLHPKFFHTRDSFRIVLSGTGKCRVHAVNAKFRSVSEK